MTWHTMVYSPPTPSTTPSARTAWSQKMILFLALHIAWSASSASATGSSLQLELAPGQHALQGSLTSRPQPAHSSSSLRSAVLPHARHPGLRLQGRAHASDLAASSSHHNHSSASAQATSATVAQRPHGQKLAQSASASTSASASQASGDDDAWSLEDPTEREPDWTFPQPFDSSLSSSFSSNTCPSFFTDFLESEDFQNCHPLSLLLSTSSAMFQAQANATNVLPYVLEQTCQVDTDQCKTLMSDLASRIQQKHVCGQDLDDGNASAQAALDGFLSYPMMLEAGCLKDDSTSHYCMAEAAANDEATSLYWWMLPSGDAMPKDTPGQCNTCTQKLMNIYSNYSSDEALPISGTYVAAAKIENADCSDHFTLEIASEASTSSAGRSTANPSPTIALASMATVFFASFALAFINS